MVCALGRMKESSAVKPSIAGGFVLVSTASLMAAWWACRSAPLGIGDFRAWLASHEMVARRCPTEEGRAPLYTFAELASLLGVAEKRARASVLRLGNSGLLQWSEQAIGFPGPPAHFDPGLEDSIGRGRGSIAIPRRMLRLLVHGGRPALIATVFAVLARCLTRRRHGYDGRGRVKAAWIACTFGLDLRRAKQARRELVELGWIDPEPAGPRLEKRWGRAFRIDLAWDRPGPVRNRTLPPVAPAERPEIATPPDNQEPFQERNQNQEPGPAGPAGSWLAGSRGKTETQSVPLSSAVTTGEDPVCSRAIATGTPGGPVTPLTVVSPTAGPEKARGPSPAVLGPVQARDDLPAPRLADVRVEDLKDTGRLLELHGQAVARGLVTASQADRLRFVGAAEHALAIGKANPAGLFAYLVLRGLWRYITGADEDRANVRIKAHLTGPSGSNIARSAIELPATAAGRDGRGPRDVEVVAAVRSAAIRAGIYRDPFPEFARRHPDWDRGRWDRALAELGVS